MSPEAGLRAIGKANVSLIDQCTLCSLSNAVLTSSSRCKCIADVSRTQLRKALTNSYCADAPSEFGSCKADRRACANASSCSLWFFSGLNWATEIRYRRFSLRSMGSCCRVEVLHGGNTTVGALLCHQSCAMWPAVQVELTIETCSQWKACVRWFCGPEPS